MKKANKVTEGMTVAQAIRKKGSRARAILSKYFFDRKRCKRALTIEVAAVKAGLEYKIGGVLVTINNLSSKRITISPVEWGIYPIQN